MGKITRHQIIVLQLLERTSDNGDGWKICSQNIYKIIAQMSDSLVEKDDQLYRARLTSTGKVLAEWC